jgi:hypothetical protein
MWSFGILLWELNTREVPFKFGIGHKNLNSGAFFRTFSNGGRDENSIGRTQDNYTTRDFKKYV